MAKEPPLLKTLRVLVGQYELQEKQRTEALAKALLAVAQAEKNVATQKLALESAIAAVNDAKQKAAVVTATSAEFMQNAHGYRLRMESAKQACVERVQLAENELAAKRKDSELARQLLAEIKGKREAVEKRIAQTLKALAVAAENAADDEATERAGRHRA